MITTDITLHAEDSLELVAQLRAMADQIEPMFHILQKTAGQSSAAYDPLYEKLEEILLDLPGQLEDIAKIMHKQGVEGGLG